MYGYYYIDLSVCIQENSHTEHMCIYTHTQLECPYKFISTKKYYLYLIRLQYTLYPE